MLVTNGGLPKLVNGAMTYFDGVRLTGYGGLLATLGGDIWMRKRRAMDPAFHKTWVQKLSDYRRPTGGRE